MMAAIWRMEDKMMNDIGHVPYESDKGFRLNVGLVFYKVFVLFLWRCFLDIIKHMLCIFPVGVVSSSVSAIENLGVATK